MERGVTFWETNCSTKDLEFMYLWCDVLEELQEVIDIFSRALPWFPGSTRHTTSGQESMGEEEATVFARVPSLLLTIIFPGIDIKVNSTLTYNILRHY